MTLESKVTNLLQERRHSIISLRAQLNAFELGASLPPELMERISRARTEICQSCEPELIMIADPAYYKQERPQLAKLNGWFADSPVAFGHRLGISPTAATRFVGVRGMKFSLTDQSTHIDCVEVDAGVSEQYIQALKGRGACEQFVRYYFGHIRPNERAHIVKFTTICAAAVSRTLDDYFIVEQAVRIR